MIFDGLKNQPNARISARARSLKMVIFAILAKMASISRLHTCFL